MMIEQLINGERRGAVMAGPAIGRARPKIPDLSMAPEGRFTGHHAMLKIAWAVLKSGKPCEEPGEDFYARREDPARRQAWLEAQIQKLCPGCAVTVTVTPQPDDPAPPEPPPPAKSPPPAA